MNENALRNYLQLYYTELFQANDSRNIFSDFSYSQYEKAKEMINDHYKVFQTIYCKHKDLIHSFFFELSKIVFSDFEVKALLTSATCHTAWEKVTA